jgi:amidophosphoribosyltransferase
VSGHLFGCKFLNFSRSRSELDLAGRRAIREMEGQDSPPPPEYVNPASEEYRAMVERIRHRLGLTTLQYQQLDDLVKSIGLPREQLCTFCWDGKEQSNV